MSGAHDSHGHHPENDLPEPKTPLWLPALGAAILLVGVCFWVLSGPSTPAAEGAADKPAEKPAATATAPAKAPAAAPNRGKPAGHP
jgi:hypothetical protein